jgi:hypothetical protein
MHSSGTDWHAHFGDWTLESALLRRDRGSQADAHLERPLHKY